jgi:hypothetical protein
MCIYGVGIFCEVNDAYVSQNIPYRLGMFGVGARIELHCIKLRVWIVTGGNVLLLAMYVAHRVDNVLFTQ